MKYRKHILTLGIAAIAALMGPGVALAAESTERTEPPELSALQAAPVVEPEEATCREPELTAGTEPNSRLPATELGPPPMSLSAAPGTCGGIPRPLPICSCGSEWTCLCDLQTGECRWICLCET